VGAAGCAVHLRGDLLEYPPEPGVGLHRPARHDARPEQRPFLAAGDTTADEVQAALPQRRLPAPGVGEVGVAAIHDDVALVEQRHKLIDHRVGGGARLHHHDDRPWPPEAGHEVLHRLGRDERAFVPVLGDQAAGALRRPVVQRDDVPVPGEVPGEIAPHHRQAGYADISVFPLAHAQAPRRRRSPTLNVSDAKPSHGRMARPARGPRPGWPAPQAGARG